jgi:broad specificity phosphatase PhoE
VRVTLVRHARSAPDPATPSHTWGLSDEGRRDALALRLDGVTSLFAGPEPRMAATVAHLGPVEVEQRYAESHDAGDWLSDDEFMTAIRRYHARDPLPGWESPAEVVARFTLVDGAAIVSGGRAISAVVATLTGVDGFDLWTSLRMPHVIVLDRDERGVWVASTPSE